MVTAPTKELSQEDKVHKSIEKLLNTHVVSVVDEARKYCYKTFNGVIGAVDKGFIDDRVNCGLY